MRTELKHYIYISANYRGSTGHDMSISSQPEFLRGINNTLTDLKRRWQETKGNLKNDCVLAELGGKHNPCGFK